MIPGSVKLKFYYCSHDRIRKPHIAECFKFSIPYSASQQPCTWHPLSQQSQATHLPVQEVEGLCPHCCIDNNNNISTPSYLLQPFPNSSLPLNLVPHSSLPFNIVPHSSSHPLSILQNTHPCVTAMPWKVYDFLNLKRGKKWEKILLEGIFKPFVQFVCNTTFNFMLL